MGKSCSKCLYFEKPLLNNNFEISTGAVPPSRYDADKILKNIWEAIYLKRHPSIEYLYLFQINLNQDSFLVYISLDNVSIPHTLDLDSILPKNSSCLVDFKKTIKSPDQFSAVIYRSDYLYRINDISVNEEIQIFNHDIYSKDDNSYVSIE